MFRRHGPILKATTAASAAYLVALLPTVDVLARRRLSPTGVALFFLLGVLYTQFFEYAAHRFAMHRGIPLLANVRRNHLEHHRVFHGERFRTRKPEDLAHIPGRWWIFPLLLAAHYFPATRFLPLEGAMAFLLGSVWPQSDSRWRLTAGGRETGLEAQCQHPRRGWQKPDSRGFPLVVAPRCRGNPTVAVGNSRL
jgi:hypothetical protein